MYTIIGTDGGRYGPVNADQIRQWIRQNRLERQTPIFVQGAADWTFVGLLPEFVGDFPGTPPVVQGPPPPVIVPPRPILRCSMAKAGLICGILSITIFCCCGGMPFNLLGVLFCIIALVQIGENPNVYGGKDMAIIGLVLSVVSFLILLTAFTLRIR